MERWYLHTKRADFDRMSERYKISPVTARIIRNRDVTDEEMIRRYLYGNIDDMYDAGLFKDMDKAALILANKIKQDKPIRIIGDYDIDGVCSTCILYKALRRLNARVDYAIPDRVKDGYGINQQIIEKACQEGVDTLLTCDNGISAIRQIEYGKHLGLTIIITDHHDVPTEENKELLPPADAIVNPKQAQCNYPFEGVCGAIVAYKLVEALYQLLGVSKAEALPLLEFGAIATVGDVMDLQDENRIIVKYGLELLQQTRNPGLKALIQLNDLEDKTISAYHIGFVIGPCLNAGGRLETAEIALELLLEEDKDKALERAIQLKALNDKRKSMTQEGLDEALSIIEAGGMAGDKVLVVYLPECHESLAGIIAGRIRERFEKPAIILTRAEAGVKGSGRSIESYHMFRELQRCKHLLNKFGGHPMAAGLSLKEEDIDELRRQLNENTTLTEEDFIKKVWIDVPMPLEYITEELIHEFSLLEPFGKGNPKPLFAQKHLRIRQMRVLGKNENVMKLSLVSDQGMAMDGLLFREKSLFFEAVSEVKGEDELVRLLRGSGGDTFVDIIYYPNINEYNGNRTLQVIIEYFTVSKS